ncbi:hypothetical protein MNBD_BACTEROID07-1306 [hydrothermal vent metagenome]|uniref:DUF4292 domain-containing protein n=1 Tax=hydrothermal vent metagenome TaxID=652676 RepID=A0A3B0VBI3_9ZZZZ
MSRNYRVLLISGLLAGSLFFFSACKSVKLLTKRTLAPMPFGQLYQKMEKSAPFFSYLNAKLSISYQKGEKEPVRLRAQIRLKNDSIIWMSIVPAMGIEAARVVLTADSVKLLNRMKKNYILGAYHLLDSLMHTSINFDMLQSLLLGSNVSYPLTDSSVSVDKQRYLLSMKMRIPAKRSLSGYHMLTQKIWLDPETFNIKELYLSESGMQDKDMYVFYDQYQNIGRQTFPLKMQIVIDANEKIIINITYKRTEIDIPRGFPFIIPGKYRKLI